jgi:hypothetical protein
MMNGIVIVNADSVSLLSASVCPNVPVHRPGCEECPKL